MLGDGGIHIGINYVVLNEMKQYEYWPYTEDFRLVSYLFNTENICSKTGQIVTEFHPIVQHLSKFFIIFIAKFRKSWTY